MPPPSADYLDELPLRAGRVEGRPQPDAEARSMSVAISAIQRAPFALTNRHKHARDQRHGNQDGQDRQAHHSRPPEDPGRGADQAEQHDQRIAIDIARLQPRGEAVADADRIGRAMRAEAVDRALIARFQRKRPSPIAGRTKMRS